MHVSISKLKLLHMTLSKYLYLSMIHYSFECWIAFMCMEVWV